jgi:uncharacterized membrane protein YphA (DoxX/SURF4 family)
MPTPLSEVASCSFVGVFALAGRIGIGVLFVISGALKLRQPEAFREVLGTLDLPRNFTTRIIQPIVPGVEIALGILSLIGIGLRFTAIATELTLVAFTVFLTYLLKIGYRGSCACLGSADSSPLGLVQVVRNLILIAISALPLIQGTSDACVQQPFWMMPPSLLVLSVAGMLLFAAIYSLAVQTQTFLRNG